MFAAIATGAAQAVAQWPKATLLATARARARVAVAVARAPGAGRRPPRRGAAKEAVRRDDAQASLEILNAMDFDKRPGEMPPGEAAALAAALRGAPQVILGSASYSRNRAFG